MIGDVSIGAQDRPQGLDQVSLTVLTPSLGIANREVLLVAVAIVVLSLAACATTPDATKVNSSIWKEPTCRERAQQTAPAEINAEESPSALSPRCWSLCLETNAQPDFAAAGISIVSNADVVAMSETNALPAPGLREARLLSWDAVKLVGSDVQEVFTAPTDWNQNDWLKVGGIAAGVGLAFALDENIRDAVQRNRNSSVDKVFDAIEPFGAEYSWGVLAAFYLGGEVFNNPKARSVALDGLSASFIASGLITQPMKFSTGRSRPHEAQGAYHFEPFGAGLNSSFPSGHTTQAFAVATVIAEHYDSFWVRFTSYTLASAVGYARMNNDGHWASDVVAGAAIGTFVGHVVVHFNEKHRQVSLLPIIGPDLQGVQLTWSF